MPLPFETRMTHVHHMTCAALLAALVGLWACAPAIVVHDGFDGPSLSDTWTTRKFLPGAIQLQSEVVRAGSGAARITLRAGDQIASEVGSVYERAELEESRRLLASLDTTYDYAFSLFVPREFPIVSTRLVLAQWKQRCLREACSPDNPTLAIRYQDGVLFITHQTGTERQTLYRTDADIRQRWLDFRFRLRFSHAPTGLVRAWLGDELIVDAPGVNAYPVSGGYGDTFYFKAGLYRDRMEAPMTVFFDEFRKTRVRDR